MIYVLSTSIIIYGKPIVVTASSEVDRITGGEVVKQYTEVRQEFIVNCKLTDIILIV